MAAASLQPGPPVFVVSDLCVSYKGAAGERLVVSGVSFQLHAGRILGLAGETGCGKSTAALASTGFALPGMARRTGQALLDGKDLLTGQPGDLREVWGRDIAFVPQQPSGAFSPVRKVWRQLDEALAAHVRLAPADRNARIEEALASVGMTGIAGWRRRYPFEFSGGQLQRLSLAAAMLCAPRVVIFDEPTTSLDPTTQETVLAQIRQLVARGHLAALYISHDLALLRALCDDIAIMYAGEVVEHGPAADVTTRPRHPYSAALVAAVPTIDSPSIAKALPGEPPDVVAATGCAFAPRCSHAEPRCQDGKISLVPIGAVRVRCLRAGEELGLAPLAGTGARSAEAAADAHPDPVLSARDIVASYGGQDGRVVLNGVSVSVAADEIVALVGESGSGKSTLLRAIAGLHPPAAGELSYRGAALPPRVEARTADARREIQLVFQDATAALNPRHTVGRSMVRAIACHHPSLTRAGRKARIRELLEQVQLPAAVVQAYPSQLSGGQRQRVNLARALAAEPAVLLCDEVTSSLDVSVQAGILSLIARLRRERQLAVIFVTHDLAVVRSLADRVVVMWDGAVIESQPTDALFSNPMSPRTRLLLEAASYKSQQAFTSGWTALDTLASKGLPS